VELCLALLPPVLPRVQHGGVRHSMA
jgi:hypothetical protein